MAAKKLIVGNWKMNPVSLKEAERIFRGISKKPSGKAEVVICPPSVYLKHLKRFARSAALGAQDVFWEERGAYTGEISAEMLYDIGARFVIVGHSERRALGETDEMINKKARAALGAGLAVVLCVGEKERDENHEYLSLIRSQLEKGLKNVKGGKVAIAYEPVWAIGKSAKREATAEEFLEMSLFIRKVLSDKFGKEAVRKAKMIYGGSVNPKNAGAFLEEGGADGLLVGRDSLDPKKFGEIVKRCDR